MCDGMRTEKAEFVKALDNFINARIHEGIKNYHYKKGNYEWLADYSRARQVADGHTQQYCSKCGAKRKD